MNNDYDRGEEVPTNQIIDVPVNPLPVVKLVVFLNGEQVLAEVDESIDGGRITLKNPLSVMIQSMTDADENGDYQSTVSYGSWLPMAADRDIEVERSSIISVCDPISSLCESYLEGIIDG
jgi:hypothetical protein